MQTQTLYPRAAHGHANYGWLDTRYHFSFGEYHNPDRMRYGALRVINDDVVQPGAGFDMHPHRDMEIITFVREGAITHRDSRGNQGRTEAGNVQVMSAGSGIYHSEFNMESVPTSLFQIWITPREKGVPPRWEAATFERKAADGLPLLVSGNANDREKGALYIHQDATIHGGTMAAGQVITHEIHKLGYIVVSKGRVEVDGTVVAAGDGLEVPQAGELNLRALEESEVIVIDVPRV